MEPLRYARCVNLMGCCVPLLPTLFITYGLACSFSFFAGCIFFSTNRGLKLVDFEIMKKIMDNPLLLKMDAFYRIIRIKLSLKSTHSLVYELKKIYHPSKLLLLVLSFFIIVQLSWGTFDKKKTFEEKTYSEYMEIYCGEWNEEKDAEINALFEKYSSVVEQFDAMKEGRFDTHTISIEEYNDYKIEYDYAIVRLPTIEKLKTYSENLRKLNEEGIAAEFVDETGWYVLANTNFSYVYLIIYIILFGNVFSIEFPSNMNSILNSTYRGGKETFLKKLCVVVISTIFITTLYEMFQYFDVARNFNLSSYMAPICSLEKISETSVMSLRLYFLGKYIRQMISAVSFSIFIAILSKLTKNQISAMIVSACIAFAPMVFQIFGVTILDNISIIALLGRK